MRLLTGVFFLLTSFSLSGQYLKGSWIMAYVEAKQPIYTMVEIDGEYQMADDVPQDSSFVYSNGLMLIDFDSKNPVSYSWDGKENWTYQIEADKIYLFSQQDTLYGSYQEGQFAVSSTLDDRPTIYYFKPLGFKAEFAELENTGWEVKTEGSFFSKKEFHFNEDSVERKVLTQGANEDYTFYGLENLNTIEYEISYPILEGAYSEFGMVYFFKDGKKKLKAVYYPVVGDKEPTRKELELKKIKK